MNLLAAIIDATIDQEAGRPPAEADDVGQPIRLDLHPALAVLGYYDGVYVVISDLPAGTRLSAGRSNNNGTWSLLPDELEYLTIIPSEGGKTEFLLTVSIATPDPDGYDFASMTAQFHVHVAGGNSTVPFNSLKRIEPQPQQDWPDLVQRAVRTNRTRLETILGEAPCIGTRETTPALPVGEPAAVPSPSEAEIAAWRSRQLAAERAEWQADEEARFSRAREQWWADAEELWAARAAELAERHARELMEAEARWQTREQERAAVTDALWSARQAATEVHWRSEESERFAHAVTHRQSKLRFERWKRAACWVAIAVAIGSMLVA
jgi:hypothetical protein